MAHGNSIVEILASKGVAAAPCVLIVSPQRRRYIPANGLGGGKRLGYEGARSWKQ